MTSTRSPSMAIASDNYRACDADLLRSVSALEEAGGRYPGRWPIQPEAGFAA